MICGLCNRELGDILVEGHHMIPKAKKGKEIEQIHKICHRKIHSMFSEKELANHYNTFERVREHEGIQSFVKWVAKKPLDFYSGSNEVAGRRGKRR